ncbi:bifunctional DNA primase/polymerase [Streptomyces cyaneofuscatus]|uniref:bifunctional DNA primase/polymerase n=1 Tax=Streptomyces cyaneofuscatus TaxID=66883 RepID=UPI003CEF91CB
MTETQLRVAMTWAGRGIPVVPCSRTDKGALVPGFGKDKSGEEIEKFRDPEQVSRWWSSGRFARAHVGLLTGRGGPAGRGLIVVDLDMRKIDSVLPARYADVASGADVLESIAVAAGADWPDTYTVVTPSGGVHLYFWQPEDGPLIGCATGDTGHAPALGPLIDVRGIGGYVIAAGSYSSVQGVAYRKVVESPAQPQPLPGWLLALMRPAQTDVPRQEVRPVVRQMPTGTRAERYALAALKGAADDLSSLGEGDHRRDRTFAAAARLAELSSTAPHILTEAVVREQLLAAAITAGIKGGERQATKCITNGWNRGLNGAMGGAA